MKKMVLATSNANKLREIREILGDLDVEIISLADVGLAGIEIVEDGSTYEENSLKKAREIMVRTGLDTIADDSGLEVDALDGAPGIYSARFSGEGATDACNNILLLEKLQNVQEEARTARFVSAVSVAFADGRELAVRGTVEGRIGFEPQGENGFGYDPLFYYPEADCTFAQMDSGLKNRISHRSRALRALHDALKEVWSAHENRGNQ